MFINPIQIFDLIAGLLCYLLYLFFYIGRDQKRRDWAQLRYRWYMVRLAAHELPGGKPVWSLQLYKYLTEKSRQYGLDNPGRIQHWFNPYVTNCKPGRLARVLVHYDGLDPQRALEFLEVMAREGVLKRKPAIWLTPQVGVYSLGNRTDLDEPGFERVLRTFPQS